MNVIFNEHKQFLGGTREAHEQFAVALREYIQSAFLPWEELREVGVYHLKGEFHDYKAGKPDRMVIFVHATQNSGNADLLEITPEPINGVENTFDKFLPIAGLDIIITSESGVPLAEYNKATNELNILFDVTESFSDENVAIFKYIIDEFVKKHITPMAYRHSWKYSQEKDELSKRLRDAVRASRQSEIEGARHRITEYEERIERYKREIKSAHDNLIHQRIMVVNGEKVLKDSEEKLLKDLDLILEHPKVIDLQIKGDKFHVFTDDIYAHHDRTGERYYIGKFRLEIRPSNTEVKFINLNNKRPGFWSGGECHAPHVNTNGGACLGSVASTIAELCSSMELYALTIVCVDFLENVNTSDPAGATIMNWDKVDESGKIIKRGGYETCPKCNQDVRVSRMRHVYERFDEVRNEVHGEHRVCQECRDEHYTYHDGEDVYALEIERDDD